MTTSAPGRSRSAGARTCSTKARNTAVVVGAAMVITAARPPRPRAPISVRRRQRPAGTAPRARSPRLARGSREEEPAAEAVPETGAAGAGQGHEPAGVHEQVALAAV